MAFTKTIEASRLINDRHYRTAILFHNHLKNTMRPLGDVANLINEDELAYSLRRVERTQGCDHDSADVPVVILRGVRGNSPVVRRGLNQSERYLLAVKGEECVKYLADQLAVELLRMIQQDTAEDPHVLKGVNIQF